MSAEKDEFNRAAVALFKHDKMMAVEHFHRAFVNAVLLIAEVEGIDTDADIETKVNGLRRVTIHAEEKRDE